MGELPPVPGRSRLEALFGNRAIPKDANAGLVFDRYLRIWAALEQVLRSPPSPEGMKSRYLVDDLKQFASDYEGLRAAGEPLRREAHARLESIAPKACTLRFAERFVSGLGAAHPLENGFTFDRTMGVPAIAGSGVKGMCRAQARLESLDEVSLRHLFGPEEEEKARTIGDLVFLPALPASWPRLEVDLVNCHHPRYMDGALPDPVEVESPIPVPFLTVAAATDFVYRLRSRSNDMEAEEEGFRLLRNGLEVLGIGAKTAVGYGTCVPYPDVSNDTHR